LIWVACPARAAVVQDLAVQNVATVDRAIESSPNPSADTHLNRSDSPSTNQSTISGANQTANRNSNHSNEAAILSAEEIMARVAANQDRENNLRSNYVYQQRIHIVSKKPHGRVMREETATYEVVPTAEGSDKTQEKIIGRYWQKGSYIDFEGPPVPDADSIDAQLVQQFREDFVNSKSKDGMAKDLFPLTSEEQEEMEFRLVGEEIMDGKAAYRIAFRPRDHEELTWAGDAWIDKEHFEPINVDTRLSRKMPLAIRAMLGTDLPGLGFNVHYKSQPDGVWFPTSFGTEFRLKVLFFFSREITISLKNDAFEHTHVKTKIEMAAPD
jgi:hypothetical protein